MTVSIEWTIEIGTPSVATDFTDRCEGIAISQPIELSRILTHIATLTFNNDDGALTPGAGGTYSAQPWFKQGVFIYASINGRTNVPVFHGIFDDFNLIDDGTSSTVTVTAVDWMTVAGRARRNGSFAVSKDQTEAVYDDLRYLAIGSGGETPSLPDLGLLTPQVFRTSTGGGGSPCSYTWSNQYVGDFVYNRVVPSDLCVIYPTTIGYLGGDVKYLMTTIGNTLTRTGSTATPFEFTETANSATKIPVKSIDTGYDLDHLVNDATMTIDGGTAQRATDSTSISSYGQRSINFTELVNATDADALGVATNVVSRFAEVTFGPRRITIDGATFADNPSGLETYIEDLFDVRYGIWQTATIEYTPTGAASQQTAAVVTAGRTIVAVPGRTTINVDLLPAVDYQSFMLDSDVLGVLDQNRLG